MKSVIVATSMGGVEIGRQIGARNKQVGKRWNADPADSDVGALRVRLIEDDNQGPMVVLEEDRLQRLETPAVTTPYSTLAPGAGGYFVGQGLSSSKEEFARGGSSQDVPLVTMSTVKRKPVARVNVEQVDDTWDD